MRIATLRADVRVGNRIRSFQARSGIDIYGLRINNVIEPHEYAEKFPAFVADPALRRRNIFAYIDARDLGHMVERCLRTDGLGYEVFIVANDDTSVAIPSADVYDRFYAGVERRRELDGFETFYANDKAKQLVGFSPQVTVENIATDEPIELLVYHEGHPVERALVGPSDWQILEDGGLIVGKGRELVRRGDGVLLQDPADRVLRADPAVHELESRAKKAR